MKELSDVYKFIKQADLAQCRDIAAVLGVRLYAIEKTLPDFPSAAVNEAANLMADVLLDLSKAVESEEAENVLCAQCNGSGEGMHERTSCYFCKGEGTV